MRSTDGVTDIPSQTDAERHTLELRWYEGRMLHFAEWLVAFAERHRDQLLRSASAHDTTSLLAALKRLVAETGSVYLAGELRDQRREIQNEVWYRGQRGEHDCAAIQLEWTSRHAAAWRQWRIQEYLFVADRCAEQIIEVLRTGCVNVLEPAAEIIESSAETPRRAA